MTYSDDLKMMTRSAAPWVAFALSLLTIPAVGEVVDFDDLSLAPESSWSGPDPSGVEVSGPFGPEIVGSFESRGVEFANRYVTAFDSWSGFAYSNRTDTTTADFGNQFSAYAPPEGDNFGAAFGYDALVPNDVDPDPFDPTSADDLRALPSMTLPDGFDIVRMAVTNTTYTALSMLEGGSFVKKFGGESGDDPDFLRLTAYGLDAFGVPLAGFVEFYLADYRFADNSLDYVIDEWTVMDLSALAGAKSIHFNLSSSDVGEFGMNTPSYFAVDDIEIVPAAVPEPSSLALLGGSTLVLGAVRRIRWRRLAQ